MKVYKSMRDIEILIKKLAKAQLFFALQVSSLIGIAALGIGLFVMGINGGRHTISYYATFESGETVKVDSIIAVPIYSVDDVGRVWPEYYAETKVKVAGKEMTLRSNPFLFCDNPEIEGNYAGRDVYCPLEKEQKQ